jgi:hypothetical protein
MHRFPFRVGAALVVASAATMLWAAPAFAHEERKVGTYDIEVGWQHEPTYVDQLNGVQIIIHDADGAPVDDLGNPVTLKVSVTYAQQASDPLELEPSFDADTGEGNHGEWDAAILPTAPGNYTFHLTGTINGDAVDEKFTSSDTTFDPVANPDEIEFPVKTPSNGELATNLAKSQPRVAEAQSTASSAKDSSSTATTVAVLALVVALGLGVPALVVAIRSRRHSPT